MLSTAQRSESGLNDAVRQLSTTLELIWLAAYGSASSYDHDLYVLVVCESLQVTIIIASRALDSSRVVTREKICFKQYLQPLQTLNLAKSSLDQLRTNALRSL